MDSLTSRPARPRQHLHGRGRGERDAVSAPGRDDRARPGRPPRAGRVVVVGAALLLLGCAPAREPVAILEVLPDESGAEPDLLVVTCQGDPEVAELVEGPAEVRVTVVSDVQRGQGPGCADGVTVRLAEPLGDRALVDGSTGERVPVRDWTPRS